MKYKPKEERSKIERQISEYRLKQKTKSVLDTRWASPPNLPSSFDHITRNKELYSREPSTGLKNLRLRKLKRIPSPEKLSASSFEIIKTQAEPQKIIYVDRKENFKSFLSKLVVEI